MRSSEQSTCALLADVGASLIPSGRPARASEIAAMKRFLASSGSDEQECEALINAALAGKRPRTNINQTLAQLRSRLGEVERANLVSRLYVMASAIDGNGQRIESLVHFIGAFLGVKDSEQARLRDAASHALNPRTPEDGLGRPT